MFRTTIGALCGALVLLAAAVTCAQPTLTVTITAPEPTPPYAFTGTADDPVALAASSGSALTFAWSTGSWAEFRVGWDLMDPSDPADPGWVGSGYDAALTEETGPAFIEGVHSFLISARDVSGQETWGRFLLTYQAGVPTVVAAWGAVQATFAAP